MKPKKSKKLTLIELIIAVLVLGLLTAIAMPQFVGTKANADVASLKNDIDVLHKAVDEMYVREDKLPLGEKLTVTDAKLLDAVYASGDTGNYLYKIDQSQSKKYHDKLKTKVTNDDYFIYSLETGRIFYTNGMVDGDKKVHYTMEYIGVSGLKLGTNTLISGMNVPVASPVQTLTGSIPLTSTVEIKVNGTSVPVTYENVTFDLGRNIMAGVKTKTFTSEVTLSEGKNVVTLKSGSTVTNFKIHLSDTPVIPDVPIVEPTTEPIIKPVAVISMTPEQAITTTTNIVWGYENSTAADEKTIVGAEWEGKQDVYTTEGVYTVRLRVQDSTGVWSDWVLKQFDVTKVFEPFKPSVLGATEHIIMNNDSNNYFDVQIDSKGNIHYFWSTLSGSNITIYKKVVDFNGNVIIPKKTLTTAKAHKYNEDLQGFSVTIDDEDNSYLSFKGSSSFMNVKKFNSDGELLKTYTSNTGSWVDYNGTGIDFYDGHIWVLHILNEYPVVQKIDKNLNLVQTINIKLSTTYVKHNGVEFDINVKNDKIYTLITLPGSNTLRYGLMYRVFDMTGKMLGNTLIGGSNDQRYVGTFTEDSLGNIYILGNGKGSAGTPAISYIYEAYENGTLKTGPLLRSSGFPSSVRSFMNEGKIYIMYRNSSNYSQMVYRLFE